MKKITIALLVLLSVLLPVFASDLTVEVIPAVGLSTTFSFDKKINVEGIGVFCEVETVFKDETSVQPVELSLLVKSEGKLSFQKNSPFNGYFLDVAAGFRVNNPTNSTNIGVVKAGLTTEIHKYNGKIVAHFGTVAGFNVMISNNIAAQITSRYNFINKTSVPKFTLEIAPEYVISIDTKTP